MFAGKSATMRPKGTWTSEEDAKLIELVERLAPRDWAAIASNMNGRSSKQCRERWINQLNPEISKKPWTEQEDALLEQLHAQCGNCWAKIAKHLPGRSDNSVKNRWKSTRRHAARVAVQVSKNSSNTTSENAIDRERQDGGPSFQVSSYQMQISETASDLGSTSLVLPGQQQPFTGSSSMPECISNNCEVFTKSDIAVQRGSQFITPRQDSPAADLSSCSNMCNANPPPHSDMKNSAVTCATNNTLQTFRLSEVSDYTRDVQKLFRMKRYLDFVQYQLSQLESRSQLQSRQEIQGQKQMPSEQRLLCCSMTSDAVADNTAPSKSQLNCSNVTTDVSSSQDTMEQQPHPSLESLWISYKKLKAVHATQLRKLQLTQQARSAQVEYSRQLFDETTNGFQYLNHALADPSPSPQSSIPSPVIASALANSPACASQLKDDAVTASGSLPGSSRVESVPNANSRNDVCNHNAQHVQLLQNSQSQAAYIHKPAQQSLWHGAQPRMNPRTGQLSHNGESQYLQQQRAVQQQIRIDRQQRAPSPSLPLLVSGSSRDISNCKGQNQYVSQNLNSGTTEKNQHHASTATTPSFNFPGQVGHDKNLASSHDQSLGQAACDVSGSATRWPLVSSLDKNPVPVQARDVGQNCFASTMQQPNQQSDTTLEAEICSTATGFFVKPVCSEERCENLLSLPHQTFDLQSSRYARCSSACLELTTGGEVGTSSHLLSEVGYKNVAGEQFDADATGALVSNCRGNEFSQLESPSAGSDARPYSKRRRTSSKMEDDIADIKTIQQKMLRRTSGTNAVVLSEQVKMLQEQNIDELKYVEQSGVHVFDHRSQSTVVFPKENISSVGGNSLYKTVANTDGLSANHPAPSQGIECMRNDIDELFSGFL